MDQFEKQFENLDVQSQFVEQAMSNQANLATPEDQVNSLMQQVADEHNLEIAFDMPGAAKHNPAQANAPVSQAADLNQRLGSD
jgi:charged multivesicular body protein 1